jgi:hypothetical protein
MADEYGIFNDEGCIERQFWTEEEAGLALADLYASGESGLTIHVLCPDHEEQPRDYCEECATDGDEDDEDE